MNGVDIWTDSGSTTDTAGIYSLNVATVTIGESEVNGHAGPHLYLAGKGVSFNGEFNAEGKTVTLAGGKNTFAGTTNIGTLNITGETATLSGGATITTVENAGTLAITAGLNSVTTLNTTGTLNVSGGTNTIDALNITGGTTTLSGTTETAISTLSHTGGTVEFAAGTNSITTLSSTGQINQTGGTLSVAGGNAVTLRQEAGTLNLVGDVMLSGSGERQGIMRAVLSISVTERPKLMPYSVVWSLATARPIAIAEQHQLRLMKRHDWKLPEIPIRGRTQTITIQILLSSENGITRRA